MKGKQGMVCMGLLLVLLLVTPTSKSQLLDYNEGFSNRSEWAVYRFIYIEQQKGNGGLYHKLWGTGGFYPCPDRNGKREDVVCGFSTITEYMEQRQNFGSTVGVI